MRLEDDATVATITSSKIAAAMTSLKINFGAVNASDVTSAKVIVSTTADFAEGDIVSTNAFTVAEGDVTIAIDTPTENCFYRVELSMIKTSGNGSVAVNSVSLSK